MCPQAGLMTKVRDIRLTCSRGAQDVDTERWLTVLGHCWRNTRKPDRLQEEGR